MTTRAILIASCVALALGVFVSTGMHTLLPGADRTKETLRLLRRGDRADCRPDSFRGTLPTTEGKTL